MNQLGSPLLAYHRRYLHFLKQRLMGAWSCGNCRLGRIVFRFEAHLSFGTPSAAGLSTCCFTTRHSRRYRCVPCQSTSPWTGAFQWLSRCCMQPIARFSCCFGRPTAVVAVYSRRPMEPVRYCLELRIALRAPICRLRWADLHFQLPHPPNYSHRGTDLYFSSSFSFGIDSDRFLEP